MLSLALTYPSLRLLPLLIGRGRFTPTAKRSLPRATTIRRYSKYSNYMPVSDRRTWHPLNSDRPLTTISGGSVRVFPKARSSQRSSAVPAGLAFVNPSRVLICVRRQRRKQVLHALGIAGGRGFRPPKFNWTSNYSC